MSHKYLSLAAVISMFIVLFSSCGGNNTSPAISHPADTLASMHRTDTLRNKVVGYIGAKQLNIGVAVMHLERGDTLSVNGHEHYAMMSVCKFPQAITLLHLVDSDKLARIAMVRITPYDLTQPTRSSLRKDHPKAPFTLTIPETFAYSIGQSDNVTSNVIFAMEGGPAAVEAYMHKLGIDETGVGTDYRHMRNDSLYRNWITPIAAVSLLNKFYSQKILTDTSRATLWKAMVEAPNGKDRLPGMLPPNTIIGHKTGTSGRDTANVCTAFNDIGIIQLPDGRHVAVAVFVAGSPLTDEENAKTIAGIGKIVWDYYAAK
jgi:beta-lactamase class A